MVDISENKTMRRCHVPAKNPYAPSFSTFCTSSKGQELDVELKHDFILGHTSSVANEKYISIFSSIYDPLKNVQFSCDSRGVAKVLQFG